MVFLFIKVFDIDPIRLDFDHMIDYREQFVAY